MKAAPIIQVLLWIAYPAIIFFGIQIFQPRYVAILLGLLLIIRWRREAKLLLSGLSRVYFVVFSALLLVTIITAITNNEVLLRFYPTSVNLGMLLIFCFSLKHPPSIIERVARLRVPNLTASGIRYTKRVTQVWCAFFVLNGGVSTYTALFTNREIWSLYNGFIAYILMGALFAVEWFIRQRFILQNTENC